VRRAGTSKPELTSADATRSRASLTALLASPTMDQAGRPRATSTPMTAVDGRGVCSHVHRSSHALAGRFS
jgi:hypothetical protein